VGGDHHVRRIEELDNRLDGQIKAGRRRSEEHHGFGYRQASTTKKNMLVYDGYGMTSD
jgi:hypothetical protein